MIPPDVANSLRLIQPETRALQEAQAQAQSVLPSQRLTDVLSDLVPGQRVLAEIQALLPNGNYRAVVGQRDITLALPFSAKPGDTLELEVTETDGKITLAFVSNRTTNASSQLPQESVSTSLSPAGKLIGDLVGDLDSTGKRAPPAPLNGSQPLVETMPASAETLAPVLKQALTQSGMFYEAHQARWIAGELTTEALRQEPQSRFSPLPQPLTPPPTDQASVIDTTDVKVSAPSQAAPPILTPTNTTSDELQPQASHTQPSTTTVQTTPLPTTHSTNGEPRIPQELTPLVRQQLDGLATNNFAWQGQIWQGQDMFWEIADESRRNTHSDSASERSWQSRLKLDMPNMGGIDATISLQGNGQIAIALTTTTLDAENQMRQEIDYLRQQFAASGLKLVALQLDHESPSQS